MDKSTRKHTSSQPPEPNADKVASLARQVIEESLPPTRSRDRRKRRGKGRERPAEGNGTGDEVSAPEETPRTPSDATPIPLPDEAGRHDLEHPSYFLNRELTWLRFNYRVLHEAEDSRTPLLERMKFVAIVSSNLDEFFMKRIGGLKQQVGAGVQGLTVDGRTPEQQIVECHTVIRDLEQRKGATFLRLVEQLRENDLELTAYGQLDQAERDQLRQRFLTTTYPLLTPQATDPAHPFPFISNLSLNLLVTLRYPDEPIEALARLKIPVGPGVPRFVQLEGSNRLVCIEEIVKDNLDLMFPGMDIERCDLFRVTRNANTDLEEEEADDLLAQIETGLRMRRFAPVVRLEVSSGMSPQHRGMLAAELGLDEASDVFEVDGFMGMADLEQLVALDFPDLKDPPHHPVDHPKLIGEGSIFHKIRDAGTVLVFQPYESFETSVEQLLREASRDPKVRAIKMTLYRTSDDSRALGYLIDAARNGKQVAVVMELKARFDEAANIRWANRMGEMGIHVTYGVVGLKTHCKAILIVRQDYYGIKRYSHIGTGNYHAETARLYSDIGLITCDDEIGEDLTELFNYLTTGFKPNRRYHKLLPSPKMFKRALLEKIEREVQQHEDQGGGLIQFKMNALEDPDVTRALYRAAQAGVHVDLLVRDTCRLRPGIPGLSENVRVVSIVGRFLEHARLFYFRNGGDEEYFIGSADCMQRNLMSRVEIVVPVEAPELRDQLRFMLDTQLEDLRSAWEMLSDGSYVQCHSDGKPAKGTHQVLAAWAERRHKEATRLRRRKPRGISQLLDD